MRERPDSSKITINSPMVMLWSTSRFQSIANGSGGFAAARQAELRRNVATFPDRPSIDYLRSQGVKQVLLLRAYAPGTSWDRAGDVPVERILFVLAEKLSLPRVAPDGQLMSYKFHHRRMGKQLRDDQSLEQQGVEEADVLRIQPEITAGAGGRRR